MMTRSLLFIALCSISAALAMSCSRSPPQEPSTTMLTLPDAHPYTTAVAMRPADFTLPIQAAGVAHIEHVDISGARLTLQYAYLATDSTKESREGVLRMERVDDSARYEGTWRPRASQGHVYEGTLSLEFTADGEAQGSYLFAGRAYQIAVKRR